MINLDNVLALKIALNHNFKAQKITAQNDWLWSFSWGGRWDTNHACNESISNQFFWRISETG